MSRMVPLQSRIDTPRPMPAIQRASDATGPALEAASRFSAVPPIVNEVLSTPGKALDPVTREMMGTRLGHDFGKVRVQADSRAAASAKAIDATAYTVGSHVVFDEGGYAPHSPKGRQVLAHELIHTLQQSDHGAGAKNLKVGDPAARSEKEADQAVMTSAAHQPLSIKRQAAPVLDILESFVARTRR